MKSQNALALVLLSFLGPHCSAQVKSKPELKEPDMVSTRLDDCHPTTTAQDHGARICKGIEGYSLLLTGDGPKPEIYLIKPQGQRQPVEIWNPNDPGFLGVGSLITWEVVHVPQKSVALIFRPEIERRPDYSYFGGYDVIVRVHPGPVCMVGSVPNGSTSTMLSHGIAQSPQKRPCLRYDELEKRDWFRTTERLAGEGQIKEAQLALANVTDLSQRFINYKEIADAQYKTNDAEGARRTLMTGREEAIKNKSILEFDYTLIHIVAGFTATGFYDDAKSAIKLFEDRDQLRMYLIIALNQGERKDFDAAKVTFRETLQRELDRPQRMDWNLKEICEAQARMRLFEEASHTLSLIQNPDAKNSCQSFIPRQTPQ